MEPVSEITAPDWKPLEAILPARDCSCFMYMGRTGEIVLYKHSVTRRYLNIDRTTGRLYQYVDGLMSEIDRDEALEYVFG
jgi:hypothetical protein